MNKSEDVLLLGIGGAGCRVIQFLVSAGCRFELGAIDTDKDALKFFEDKPVHKIEAGSGWTWREGSGCGGDAIRGEQAVAKERQPISQMMEGKRLIIAIAGLGGGVATGGVRTIASVARTLKIPMVFLLTTPFSFEAFAKRKSAEECVEELLPIADLVMRIPNDLLFSMLPSETPFEEAFTKSCEELARSAEGLAAMLNCENSLNSDFAGFMAALKGKKCSCGLGVGIADGAEGLDRCGIAMERMLGSPFLGGVSKLAHTDAAVITVSGGADLQLGEVKRMLEIVTGMLPPEANVLTGVNICEQVMDRVQITAICIKYDRVPQTTRKEKSWENPPSRPAASSSESIATPLEQGMFELHTFNKGVFANIAPTLFKGEDLDVPTYQRKEIPVSKGTTSR